ncbi:nitrogen-responsive transcriptional regulator [Maudiozyma humilis]|uniref:Nitrogen-responsive transcriptional regulator n=1 Tax=Maudiozyma humilis TaxID=51915 RepID=A0AAV5RZK0_MAUHU|nr:nitrogen-responsive transcriptional regulator [Kazachstania humilis]
MPQDTDSEFHSLFGGNPPPGNTNSGHTAGDSAPGKHDALALGFDDMLEVLPDDINFGSFFTPLPMNDHDDSASESGAPASASASNVPVTNTLPQDSGIVETPGSIKYESIFSQMSTAPPPQGSAPIDIANQQNGEIAGLWDFNIDQMQMTPSNSSDSATISAPNSYNSENLHMSTSHNQSAFNQFKNLTSHALTEGKSTSLFPQAPVPAQQQHPGGYGFPSNALQSFNIYNIPNSSTAQQQQPAYSASPMGYSNTPTTLKQGNAATPSIYQQIGRRSSMSHDKGISIPLSSSNTNNSVRKNQLGRQLSSTSLTTLNKRTSSISDISASASNSTLLSRKPAVQCYNCKTFKTPLWRRDPNGNTLCNACGLFQKLHGTMRPLSLKSDVIKKRNTKKKTKKAQAAAAAAAAAAASAQGTTGNTPLPEQHAMNMPVQNNIRRNFVPPSISSATATTQMTRTAAQSNISKSRNSRGSFVANGPGSSPAAIMRMNDDDQRAMSAGGYGGGNGMGNPGLSRIQSNGPNRIGGSPGVTANDISQLNSVQDGGGPGGMNSQQRWSRRGSTSSMTSSRSSSSRSMIPILPKLSNSNNNSAASSPRVVQNTYGYPSNSPMQPGLFSTSTGRNGITIPRRKLSRNASHSSSFMAASLQQLQQQNAAATKGNTPGGQIQQDPGSVKYGQADVTPSPMRDDYNMFVDDQQESSMFRKNSGIAGRNSSNVAAAPYQGAAARSHTSLLSQQLHDSNGQPAGQHEFHSNGSIVTEQAPGMAAGSEQNGDADKGDASVTVSAHELDWLKFGI